MIDPIPVVLFAYSRPAHLARVLACLRENNVPLILAYADGAKGEADAARVAEARAMLRAVDWCELRLVEREANLGLGRNVLTGVEEVAARHEAFIVWEDDLICVPGTYEWMCAALRAYENEPRVMSVSAWTHPRVTPVEIGAAPYVDARADCWVWGAWARSWRGMGALTAREKMRRASARGIAPDAYGADLPEQASYEERRNVWAVRWLYHHFQYGGLCVRPPWSLVEHIGFDALATNAADSSVWSNPPLRSVPPVPERWPEASEHVDCRRLWRRANPYTWRQMAGMARRMLKGGGAKDALPSFLIDPARRVLNAWRRSRLYRGDYANWDAARAASTGYDANLILEKAVAATRAVRDGQALWERDTVLFHEPERNEPLLRALAEVAAPNGGRLSVLDFGGALGSTWWQHRQWLGDPGSIRWSVIEQPAFVEAGRREFTVGPLRFYGDIDACLAVERPDVILLSSVLPYLENPHAVLADLASRGCGWIIIDRTGFATRGRDWLAVQHVPEAIYPASYPCWFFDRAGLLDRLGKEWSVVAEWPTFDGNGRGYEYRGLMLKHIRPRGGGTSCT